MADLDCGHPDSDWVTPYVGNMGAYCKSCLLDDGVVFVTFVRVEEEKDDFTW